MCCQRFAASKTGMPVSRLTDVARLGERPRLGRLLQDYHFHRQIVAGVDDGHAHFNLVYLSFISAPKRATTLWTPVLRSSQVPLDSHAVSVGREHTRVPTHVACTVTLSVLYRTVKF